MDNLRLARTWMIIAGVALVGAGLIGFIPDNPIASANESALFRVNAIHNIIHIGTGLLALAIAFGTNGRTLADGTIAFGVLYAVVAVLLVSVGRSSSRWYPLAVGLVIGGAVGNVIDRLFRGDGGLHGAVVDFIDLQWWPIFNVADMAVVIGGGLLLVSAVRP